MVSTKAVKQQAYRDLFRSHLHLTTLQDFRESLNQKLVPCKNNLKEQFEHMTRRQTRPGPCVRSWFEEELAHDYSLSLLRRILAKIVI